jgi:hypothetical protein
MIKFVARAGFEFGTNGPFEVTPVTVKNDPPEKDGDEPEMTVAAPGEIPEKELTGRRRPGFNVPFLLITVTLTLLIDELAGYDPIIVFTEGNILVPMLMVEFK